MRWCVGGLVVALAACTGGQELEASKAFCRAADRYDNTIERQIETGEVDIERQIGIVRELARTAPDAIKTDAELFLDSLQRVEEDPSIRDDPDVREAVDDVNRYANQACGVYDRDRGI